MELVHDYLTQRGGAERVALTLTRAFPGSRLHAALFEPESTFPEFGSVDVRPGPLNRLAILRDHHRLAFPALAPAFSRTRVDADVVVCSSSGWAHGAHVTGRKVVYCHTPARWLYQPDRYLRGRGVIVRAVSGSLRSRLVRWDKAAARSADRYVANSSVVAKRIADIYGIESEVLAPPPALTPDGPREAPAGVSPGFALCVSRLLPYKNVDAVVRAFAQLPDERLVIAGTGPDETTLRALAPSNVTFLGRVDDEQLRWLYGNCDMLVAAAHEDFGLTPLEAAGFGKPCVVLRWGGFLDTVTEAETGVFFDRPAADKITAAIRDARSLPWQSDAIAAHAGRFAEPRFIERIREIALGSAGD